MLISYYGCESAYVGNSRWCKHATYLLILASHDVGNTQVRQDNRTHRQDLDNRPIIGLITSDQSDGL